MCNLDRDIVYLLNITRNTLHWILYLCTLQISVYFCKLKFSVNKNSNVIFHIKIFKEDV